MMYNIRSSTIRWQMPDFLSAGNSYVCSISRHLRGNCKTEKIFDLENEGQGLEERNLCPSTGNVRIHIAEFSVEF